MANKKEKNKTITADNTDSSNSYTKHFFNLHKGGWWLVREFFVVFSALVFIATLFISWKLSQGPIELDFLTPHIEQELTQRFPNLKVKLGGTSIIWQKETNSLNLRTNNVELYENNKPLLVISHTDIGVSIKYAILGQLKIKNLSFAGLAFKIHKTNEGDYKIIIGDKKEIPLKLDTVSDNSDNNENILLNVLSSLKRVSFKNTNIVFKDIAKNKTWRTDKANAFFIRNDNGINGSVTTQLLINDNKNVKAKINSNLYYNSKTKKLQISTIFEDLNPKDFAEKFPEYPEIKNIDSALFGKFDITMNSVFSIENMEVEISSDNAKITISELYKNPLNISNLKAKIYYNKLKNNLVLKQLSFDVEEKSHIHVAANTSIPNDINNDNNFVIDAKLSDFSIDKLNKYWPEKLAKPARKWVVNNLSKGIAKNATISIAGNFIKTADNRIKLEKISNLSGDIDFENIDVKYLKGMPQIISVNGSANYNKHEFNIHANSGQIDDIKLNSGDIKIAHIGIKSKVNINIDLKAEGSVKTALKIIDNPPLSYGEKLGFNIDSVEGFNKTELNFAFPLKHGLSMRDVKVKIKSSLSDIYIPNMFATYNLKAKELELSINNKEMHINGQADLDYISAVFKFTSNFSKSAEISYQITGKALSPTNKLLEKIKLPKDKINITDTEIPIDFTFTKLRNNSNSKLFIDAKLNNSDISIPALSYTKDKNKPANISLFIHMDKNKIPYKLSSILVKMPKFKLDADINLKPNTQSELKLASADIKNFSLNKTRASATINFVGNDKLQVKIKGPYIDISPILEFKKKLEKQSKTPLKNNYILEVMIDAGFLSLFPNTGISEVKLFIRKNKWNNTDKLELDGITGNKKIYYRYLPTTNGQHSLFFEADNAGAALMALGISKSVRGGRLVIKGSPIVGGGKYDITGRAIISDFTVVNMPVLARLLNALSPTGLQNLLSDDGISFSTMKSYFTWKKTFYPNSEYIKSEVITIRKGKTSGSSLGLTFEGYLDQTKDTIDLNGTIVPVSGLNKAIGGIPIIGDILTGGSDAVFAATYSIKGPKNAAKITVNPLAALAPGFLRMLFFE